MIYDKNTQADASSPKNSPEQFWQLKLTIIGGSHPPLGTNNDGGGRIIPPRATSKRQGPAPLSQARGITERALNHLVGRSLITTGHKWSAIVFLNANATWDIEIANASTRISAICGGEIK